MKGVDAVIVQISRLGSGDRNFQGRDKNKHAGSHKNNLATTFLYSREVGLLNCQDLDENHQPGDWAKCAPIWTTEKATRTGANSQKDGRFLRKSSKKCEIAPQINQYGAESYFYKGSGIILDIHNVNDGTEIKSFMLIWHDYMGLICHFSTNGNEGYQMLQVVNFKAVGMSESRHCAFHAVSVGPTNKVRFTNLRCGAAKIRITNNIMYAHCENDDKVVLLDLMDKCLLPTDCGLTEDEEVNVIYYRIETRFGKIYISLCYFQNGEEDGEFWEAQMENLTRSCRASNEEDEHLLNSPPSKNSISSHDFRKYWIKYFESFWDPENDKLEWIGPFLIPSEDVSSTDTSIASSGDESEDLTRSESNLMASVREDQTVDEEQSMTSEELIDAEEMEKSEFEPTLTLSSTSVPSSVCFFQGPAPESESCDSGNDLDKTSEEPLTDAPIYLMEEPEIVVNVLEIRNAFENLSVSSDVTVSISSSDVSNCDLEESRDEDRVFEADISDTDTFVTANGRSRVPSPDIAQMSMNYNELIEAKGGEEFEVPRTIVEEKDQELLENLAIECNHRTEVLRPRIEETLDENFKLRRSSENSSVLNSSTDSSRMFTGNLGDPPRKTSRCSPKKSRTRYKDETPPYEPQQPETPLLVTEQSVYVPTFPPNSSFFKSPELEGFGVTAEQAEYGVPLKQAGFGTSASSDHPAVKEVFFQELIGKRNVEHVHIGHMEDTIPAARRDKKRRVTSTRDIPITAQPVGRSVFSRRSSESSVSSPSPSASDLKPDVRSLQMGRRGDHEQINEYLNRMLNPYDDQMGQVKRCVIQFIMENGEVLRFIKKHYRGLFECLTQMYKFPEFVCFYDLERLKISGLPLESSGSPQVDRISMETQIFKYMYENGDLWAEIINKIPCVEAMTEQFKDRI